MTDYNKKARDVAAKFAKQGQKSALRRTVVGEYDTETRTYPVVSDICYVCYVMSFDYDLQSSGMSNEELSLIQVGDKQILLPAFGLPIEPTVGDTLIAGGTIVGGTSLNGGKNGATVVGGKVWKVANVKSVAPIGIAVLHELNGRL